MVTNNTPPIPLAIVEWLERLFPVHLHGPNDAHSQVMFDSGAASVARKVRATYTSQNKTE